MSNTQSSPTTARLIGTVEILRTRVYPLDFEATNATRSEVVVEPGVYDLFRDGFTTYWMMRGRLNTRHERMGDGMFGMRDGDRPSDIEVVFPSRRFGPDEWRDLLAEPAFIEGDPEQRMRVTVVEDGAA